MTILKVYTWRGDQSTERKEYIPGAGTNRPRGKSIYLAENSFWEWYVRVSPETFEELSPSPKIRRRKRGYILTTYPSDAGSAGIFSRRTHRTQEAWVYSHDVPIRRRKR
eukprot:1128799-Prorocentrum_minimum.AAC.1